MMLRIVSDLSFDTFLQINRLSTATGLGIYSLSRIAAIKKDETMRVRSLVMPQYSRNALGFIVYRNLPPEAEIFDLSIHPLFQRMKLGSILVKAVLREFTSGQVEDCFLEVRESNLVAIRFYEHLGFEILDKRPGYYRQPIESALVMKWTRPSPDLVSSRIFNLI